MPEDLFDDAEFLVESRTQDAATINRILQGEGYDTVEAVTQDDQPVSTEPAEPETGEPNDDDPEDPEEEISEGGEEDETETPEEPAKPPKKSGSARLKEKLNEERQRRQELEQRIADLEKKFTPPATPAAEEKKPAAVPPPAEDVKPAVAATPEAPLPEPAEPDVEAYDDPDEYRKAVNRYNKDYAKWAIAEDKRLERETARIAAEEKVKTERKSAEREEQERIENDAKTRITGFRQQIDTFKTETPDFEQTIQASKILFSNSLRDAIVDSDDSARALYLLAKHQEEFDRIAKATALSDRPTPSEARLAYRTAVREIERFLEKHPRTSSAPTAGTPAPAASAPKPAPAPAGAPAKPVAPKHAPVTPIGNRGPSPQKKLANYTPDELRDMDMDEYRRLRAAEG